MTEPKPLDDTILDSVRKYHDWDEVTPRTIERLVVEIDRLRAIVLRRHKLNVAADELREAQSKCDNVDANGERTEILVAIAHRNLKSDALLKIALEQP